ncbi:MAG: MBOAT family protein [Thermoflexibacter sp.]
MLYYSWSNQNYRNIVLTLMSFVFYAWGEPVWVSLLIFSATIDYFHGILIEKYLGTPYQKLPLISSLVLNLSLLGSFKYSGFITENLNALTGLSLPVPAFSLPIGISFYTFQTISYVIDVHRGEIQAQKSFMKFVMFVSLYHQLVAGPIVRYAHIAHEINNREHRLADLSQGISRFCIGLFKKVGIANVAGELATTYLDTNMASLAVTEAWFGITVYAFQIYFDFSGYSDMAIGLGKMFGFHYHENFNYPYTAKSAIDFWRRWHISLSSFFRDYVYIPLGGNKQGLYRNLLIVWFLTGLWHGASWNFILWGLFWGLLIMLERLFLGRVLAYLPRFVGHFYLLLAMLVGWVFFYFTELSKTLWFLKILFGFSTNPWHAPDLNIVLMNHVFWLLFAILFSMPVYMWFKQYLKQRFAYVEMALSFVFLLLATAMLVGNTFNPFLYFRF